MNKLDRHSRVPPYAPDGLDHWLTCDIQYEPLIKCKASIDKKTAILITDYASEQAYLTNSSDRITTYTLLKKLKEDWQQHHMYYFFMNTMTNDEYVTFFRKPFYNQTLALHKQKEEEKRYEDSNYTEVTKLDSDDQRLQNISEYGW